MEFDLILHNGVIVTVNPDFDIIENGVVCIDGGTIQRVEARTDDLSHLRAKETIDAKGGIILPGLINTHTHLPMTLFRGLADDLPLDKWLGEYIFPAENKHLNRTTVEQGTLLACAEMILSGTTTCCDGYFYEDNVASAVRKTGLRAVLGQGVIDFPAPGVPDPSDNVKHAEAFVKKWQGMDALISPAIFCHSPYTCSAETLKKAKSIAEANDVLFQIHVAETKAEQKQIQEAQQTTPIRYLDRLGILDRDTLLVHSVWADQADIETIAERGSSVSHNPESNMKLASGIAPVVKFLAAGIPTGLGTDGCASNNNLDLFQAMGLTAKLHKVNTLDPTVMDAQTVLKMATIHGAEAIGLAGKVGSIEPGKAADLIVIDTEKPHLVPLYNPVSHLVYAARGSDVRYVIVAGRILLREQHLCTIDAKDIIEKIAGIGETVRKA